MQEGLASGFTKRLQSSFLPDPLTFLLGTVSNPGSLTPYTQIFPLNTQRCGSYIRILMQDLGLHTHMSLPQRALGRTHVFSCHHGAPLRLRCHQEPGDQQQSKPALHWHAAHSAIASPSTIRTIFCLGLNKRASGSPCPTWTRPAPQVTLKLRPHFFGVPICIRVNLSQCSYAFCLAHRSKGTLPSLYP